MAFEIELKVWVDDPQALEASLEEIALFVAAYDKKDSYFTFPGENNGTARTLRLRREGEVVTVTMKEKRVVEGIEQNVEEEFTVSSFDKMKQILEALGCRCYIEKRKKGKKFRAGELNLELSEVEKLGWFLEIEKMEEKDDPEIIARARDEIRSMLRKVGIEEDKIEPRYYTEMLQGKL